MIEEAYLKLSHGLCLLKLVTRKKKETDTKLAEVTQRIRCLLRDRAKCFKNEWRQFARKITVSA